MKDYKKLNVFQKTRHFNTQIYSITKTFPDSEKFGITSQIRRASISIATNIAEGCGRDNNKEFARFLYIAYASACEVECLLILSTDLKILDPESATELGATAEEIKKMLFAFIQKLKTDNR
jgi:four helix bundle protein